MVSCLRNSFLTLEHTNIPPCFLHIMLYLLTKNRFITHFELILVKFMKLKVLLVLVMVLNSHQKHVET